MANRKIKMRKRFSRSRFGMGARGAMSPKQRAAIIGRSRIRRMKGR